MDGWETTFLLRRLPFRGHVSCRVYHLNEWWWFAKGSFLFQHISNTRFALFFWSKAIMDYPPKTCFLFEDTSCYPNFFQKPSPSNRGHVDGYYDTAKAEAALGDAVQVADLLETPPWNPTVQEMPLVTARNGEVVVLGWIKPCKSWDKLINCLSTGWPDFFHQQYHHPVVCVGETQVETLDAKPLAEIMGSLWWKLRVWTFTGCWVLY